MKSQGKDIAELDAGLKSAEEGLDFIPVEVEATLKDLGLDELHRLFRVGCNMACVLMAQKGWVLMMIKRKVGHGNFKEHLRAQRFDYSYSTMCMNVARAIAKHPALAKIGNVHTLRRVAYLPDQTQAEIEVELTAPEHVVEDGKLVKRNRHWKDLRPWVLLRIASDLKEQAKKPPRKKKNVDPSILEQEAKEREEKEWAEFMDALDDAHDALNALAAVKIKPEWRDRIFKRELLKKLGRTYEKVSKSLAPVEEVLKRKEIVHLRGFGAKR